MQGEEGFEQSAPPVLHIRDTSLDPTAVPPPEPGVLLSPQSGRGGIESPPVSKGGQGGHRANGRDRDGNNGGQQ